MTDVRSLPMTVALLAAMMVFTRIMWGKFQLLWLASGRDDLGAYLGSVAGQLPQRMVNVPVNDFVSAVALLEDETVMNAVHEAESVLNCNGRVVLRPSGTEAVIRVMVEGVDVVQVETLTEQLTKAVETSSKKY